MAHPAVTLQELEERFKWVWDSCKARGLEVEMHFLGSKDDVQDYWLRKERDQDHLDLLLWSLDGEDAGLADLERFLVRLDGTGRSVVPRRQLQEERVGCGPPAGSHRYAFPERH